MTPAASTPTPSETVPTIAVRLPVALGAIGPDILQTIAVTAVQLSTRSITVESDDSLAGDRQYALAFRLPDDSEPATIVGIASCATTRCGTATPRRTVLGFEQLTPHEYERIASFIVQEDLRQRHISARQSAALGSQA